MKDMTTRWIVWAMITVAVGWAVSLLFSSAPLGSTPMSGVHETIEDRSLEIVILFVAAGLAGWALFQRPSIRTLLALLPLQALLFFAAANSLEAVIDSAYADGVTRPRGFIFSDQLLTIVAVFWFTVAVIFEHRGVRI